MLLLEFVVVISTFLLQKKMEEIVYNCSLKFYKIHFSWAYRIYNSHEEDWAGFLFVQDRRRKAFLLLWYFSLISCWIPGEEKTAKRSCHAQQSQLWTWAENRRRIYRVSQKWHPFKNITDLQSDDKIVKIMENIEFLYLSNLASFMGNPV